MDRKATTIRYMTYRWLLIISLVVFSACAGSTSKRDTTGSGLDVAQEYLQKARNAKGLSREQWLLKATEALLANQRTDKALAILQQVNQLILDDLARQLYHSLLGQSLYLADKPQQALLQFQKVSNLNLISTYQQQQFHSRYADALTSQNNHYESFLQRLAELDLTQDPFERDAVKELLWQSLLSIGNPAVYQTSLNDRRTEGWLDLASIAKTYETAPEQLLGALTLWQERYQQVIPPELMPLDMSRVLSVQIYQPDRLAVLLPMTGSLADSADHIRRGILAAHYQYQLNKELIFIDTNAASATESYQQAVDQQANFVLGPLQQEQVQTLSESEYLPIPILAINRLIVAEAIWPEEFYQFGLPIEDEVTQIADRILTDGKQRGLLLLPEGSQGDRALAAFTEQYERQDGIIQDVKRYRPGEDYSAIVQSLLSVDQSLQRHRRLEQLTGVSMEFQARRRQDIDFIFFLADPEAGRRIKPFIDFYYAHDIALYANTAIYSGLNQPQVDNDLDNVNFPSLPLLQQTNMDSQKIRSMLSSFWPESNEGLAARLFALGYDSYRLIPELSKLRHFPNYSFDGLTGLLTINELGQIKRQLPWARFVNGVPRTLRISDDSQSD